MAFNKVFIILVLVSCALAMPVKPVEEPASTSVATKIDIEDSGVSTTTEDEERTTTVPPVDQEIVKRSIEETDSEDLDTAAGTNVLRPLFVYRQQVAYRQRIKNARRGNRVFN